jgi:uncharacterized protein YjbI with pentapeptide repeats
LLRRKPRSIVEQPESITGDQPLSHRQNRGPKRYPSWVQVKAWRDRWTPGSVAAVVRALNAGASPDEVGRVSGFGTLEAREAEGGVRQVPDLRGIDLTMLPRTERRLGPESITSNRSDLSYAKMEGARLTDADLSDANLYRAQLQKATLRRTNFTGAVLAKAHLEDADLRGSILANTNLGHIRYTEDSFLHNGTILMETHLNRALYVDPLLEQYAKDQYYLYVKNYRNRHSRPRKALFFLWWLTSDYGRSVAIFSAWCVFVILSFWLIYLPSPEFLGTHWREMAREYGPLLKVGEPAPGGPLTYLYFSVISFTTLGLGNVQPANWQAEALVILEVILGYVMFGVLLSIVANKVARRA